jgi:hypothetical protein
MQNARKRKEKVFVGNFSGNILERVSLLQETTGETQT